MPLHVSSTMCSSSGGQKLYYTACGNITPIGGHIVHPASGNITPIGGHPVHPASGNITPIGGHPVHLCTGWPPLGVMIPEAV